MVQAYFEDMYGILSALAACANKNATVWLVVSTSAYAGVEIPVDFILGQIGERVGWFLQDIAGQHASRVPGENILPFHLRESLVILSKGRLRRGSHKRFDPRS
jgi:hypothetical protein